MLKTPKGIRSAEEWYISLSSAAKAELASSGSLSLRPRLTWQLEKIIKPSATGRRGIFERGRQFGAQNGPLVAPKTYRELFLPFHKQINDWVHKHTTWKTFIHSCGSVFDLIEDFIAAGFDDH